MVILQRLGLAMSTPRSIVAVPRSRDPTSVARRSYTIFSKMSPLTRVMFQKILYPLVRALTLYTRASYLPPPDDQQRGLS